MHLLELDLLPMLLAGALQQNNLGNRLKTFFFLTLLREEGCLVGEYLLEKEVSPSNMPLSGG